MQHDFILFLVVEMDGQGREVLRSCQFLLGKRQRQKLRRSVEFVLIKRPSPGVIASGASVHLGAPPAVAFNVILGIAAICWRFGTGAITILTLPPQCGGGIFGIGAWHYFVLRICRRFVGEGTGRGVERQRPQAFSWDRPGKATCSCVQFQGHA